MEIREIESKWCCERCNGEGLIFADGANYRERIYEMSCMDLTNLSFRQKMKLARGNSVICPDCNGSGKGTYQWAELV